MRRRLGVRRPILSIVVAGVLLALPVLGLECQATCVRGGGAGAAPASPAPHCPAHDDAGSNPHPSAPSDSDCCVHHEVAPALKVAVERAGSRSAAIGAGVFAPAVFGRQPLGIFVAAADDAAPRERLSHSSPILRL